MAAVLDEDDYDIIEDKLNEGVDLGLLTDIVSYLIEEWSARPTKPSSASSGSRKSTGKRSTAKRPAKAKTRSTWPIDRFCNYIMWWALQRVKDADDFRRKINAPAARPGTVDGAVGCRSSTTSLRSLPRSV